MNIPSTLLKKYILNLDYFYNWRKDHREHQLNAIDACSEAILGQVSLPTGTGKTRVQIDLHIQEMIKLQNNNQFGMFVIAAHRLVLCNQLLKELVDIAANSGIPFDLLFVGSDRYDESFVHAEYKHLGLNRNVMEATSTTKQGDVLQR